MRSQRLSGAFMAFLFLAALTAIARAARIELQPAFAVSKEALEDKELDIASKMRTTSEDQLSEEQKQEVRRLARKARAIASGRQLLEEDAKPPVSAAEALAEKLTRLEKPKRFRVTPEEVLMMMEKERQEEAAAAARKGEIDPEVARRILHRSWLNNPNPVRLVPAQQPRPELNPDFIAPPFTGLTTSEGIRRRLGVDMTKDAKQHQATLEARRAAVEAVKAAVDEGIIKTPQEIAEFAGKVEAEFVEHALRQVANDEVPAEQPLVDPQLLAMAGAAQDAADTERALKAEEDAIAISRVRALSLQPQAAPIELPPVPEVEGAGSNNEDAKVAEIMRSLDATEEDAKVLLPLLQQHCGLTETDLRRKIADGFSVPDVVEECIGATTSTTGSTTTTTTTTTTNSNKKGQALLDAWQDYRATLARKLLGLQEGQRAPWEDSRPAEKVEASPVSAEERARLKQNRFSQDGLGIASRFQRAGQGGPGSPSSMEGFRRSLLNTGNTAEERAAVESLLKRMEGPPENVATVMVKAGADARNSPLVVSATEESQGSNVRQNRHKQQK